MKRSWKKKFRMPVADIGSVLSKGGLTTEPFSLVETLASETAGAARRSAAGTGVFSASDPSLF